MTETNGTNNKWKICDVCTEERNQSNSPSLAEAFLTVAQVMDYMEMMRSIELINSQLQLQSVAQKNLESQVNSSSGSAGNSSVVEATAVRPPSADGGEFFQGMQIHLNQRLAENMAGGHYAAAYIDAVGTVIIPKNNTDAGIQAIAGLGVGKAAGVFSTLAAKGLASASKVFPKTVKEMEELLQMKGVRIPDSPISPGRNKVVFEPSDKIKLIFEEHPYHTNAPSWHKGPHWHMDTPGQSHVRYLPGDPIPGY